MADEQESSTIKQMREELAHRDADLKALREKNDELSKEKTELNQKVTAAEREKMGEIERLQAEINDRKNEVGELSNYRSKAEKYEGFAQQVYEKKISEAPEDVREHLQSLSSVGDWADRLGSLESAFGLISKVQPVKAGTNTNPGPASTTVSQPTEGAKEKEVQAFNPKISLGDALAAKRQ